MLNQDVCTFLAAGPAGIGQWSQTPGITAPHIHSVLQEKAYSQLAYVEGKASALREGERQLLKAEKGGPGQARGTQTHPDEQLCKDHIGHGTRQVQGCPPITIPVCLVHLLLGPMGQQHHQQPQVILHHSPE